LFSTHSMISLLSTVTYNNVLYQYTISLDDTWPDSSWQVLQKIWAIHCDLCLLTIFMPLSLEEQLLSLFLPLCNLCGKVCFPSGNGVFIITQECSHLMTLLSNLADPLLLRFCHPPTQMMKLCQTWVNMGLDQSMASFHPFYLVEMN
jgi:hypothetical protein